MSSKKNIMTKEDLKNLDYICKKFKTDILMYDANQKIPSYLVLRIKGLAEGKFMANNYIQSNANYGYDVVRAALIVSKPSIDYAVKTVDFVDEKHKINYVLKIIESNLNDVYIKMKRASANETKVQRVDMDIIEHKGAEYRSNADKEKEMSEEEKDKEEKKKQKLEEFW